MGGVINIITKDPENIEDTNLELGVGSYDTKLMNLSHSFLTDKSSLMFVYDDLNSDGYRDNSLMDRNDIFVKYKYNISNNLLLHISLRYNDTETKFPGAVDVGNSGFKNNIDRNIKITLEQILANKDRVFTIYNNNKDFYSETSFTTDRDILKKGFSLKETNYKFNSHILNYGIDINDNDFDDNLYDSLDDKVLNRSIFLQDRYELSNKSTIISGVRYDDNEKYGDNWSPRLGYIYKINTNLNFNFNAGESYRTPSFLDASGTNDLEPAENKFYDLGLKYNSENCFREISFFRREVENYIFYDKNTFTTLNLDKVTMKGLEVSAQRTLNEFWKIQFNYTYLDAENSFTDKQLIDMPYNKANLKLSYNKNNIKYVLNNTFVGERESVNRFYGMPDVKMDSYFVSDLKISNKLTENTELAVEINNLFDREYQVVDGYPMPGRNFMVNVSTKF